MVSIYLIEDINDNKYIGSTIMKLNTRLNKHRSEKTNGRYLSSSKLNLDYCIITELERCNPEDRKERERYWINNTDCVNDIKLNGPDKEKLKEYQKEYREQNKEKQKEYYKQNKEKLKEYYKQNKEKPKEYKKQKWVCKACKCELTLGGKSNHLKSQRHQLNTNIYI